MAFESARRLATAAILQGLFGGMWSVLRRAVASAARTSIVPRSASNTLVEVVSWNRRGRSGSTTVPGRGASSRVPLAGSRVPLPKNWVLIRRSV